MSRCRRRITLQPKLRAAVEMIYQPSDFCPGCLKPLPLLPAATLPQGAAGGIYAEVGKHLATLDLHQMHRQPIYAFFEDDSTLDCFPAWQREHLRWVRNGGDFNVPSGKVEQPSY